MANKNCYKLFPANLLQKLTPDMIERLEKNLEVKKQQLEALGKTKDVFDIPASTVASIDDIQALKLDPNNSTAMQYFSKEILREQLKLTKKEFKEKFVLAQQVDDEIFEIHDAIRFYISLYQKEGAGAIGRYFNEPKPVTQALKKGNYKPLVDRILIARMFDATWQKGTPLEKLKQSTFSQYWGLNIDKRLYDESGTLDWLSKHANKKEDLTSILDDLVAMSKDPSRKTSVNNSNAMQYKIAEAIRDSFKKMMIENNQIGGKMNYYNLIPKARLNANKLDTVAKQKQAVEDIADALDDRTVFELTDLTKDSTPGDILNAKRNLARREVERTVNAGRDENAFGISKSNRDFFIYKDGASLYKVIANYTSEMDFGTMLFAHMRKLTDQHALTKQTGGDPYAFLNRVESKMLKDPVLRDHVEGTGWKVYKSTIKHQVNPTLAANNTVMNLLKSYKNLNLMKLGFVPLDQLIAEPTFAFMRTMSDTQFQSKFNLLGNIGPLQGKKKRLAARFNGVAMESQIGAINNRLFGSFNETLNESASANVTGKLSNKFIWATGATWLSDGQAAATFNVYRMDISEAFKSGIKWQNLDKKHLTFKRDLMRFGIDEEMWNQASAGYRSGKFRNKDDGLGGLFDPALIDTPPKKFQARKKTDYDVWMAFFQKKVDGFGRMRPGELATARTSFYTDDQTIGTVMRTMMQFKTFTLAFGQRVYGDAYLKGGKLGVLKTAAYLGVAMIPAAMIRVQMTEMSKGNPPLKFGEDLWGQAIARSGITGWLGLVFFDDFIKDTLKSFNPEEYDEVNEMDLLISLFKDIAGITYTNIATNFVAGVKTGYQGIRALSGDEDADVYDKAVDTTVDLFRSFAPNGPGISLLMNYLLYDGFLKMFNPDAYDKREQRIEKRMEENYSGGAQNLYEWLEQF